MRMGICQSQLAHCMLHKNAHTCLHFTGTASATPHSPTIVILPISTICLIFRSIAHTPGSCVVTSYIANKVMDRIHLPSWCWYLCASHFWGTKRVLTPMQLRTKEEELWCGQTLLSTISSTDGLYDNCVETQPARPMRSISRQWWDLHPILWFAHECMSVCWLS